AVRAADVYYNGTGGTNPSPHSYGSIAGAKLRTLVPGISPTLKAGANAAKDGYCLQDTVGTDTWSYAGGVAGASTVTQADCAAGYGVASLELSFRFAEGRGEPRPSSFPDS